MPAIYGEVMPPDREPKAWAASKAVLRAAKGTMNCIDFDHLPGQPCSLQCTRQVQFPPTPCPYCGDMGRQAWCGKCERIVDRKLNIVQNDQPAD